MADILIDFIKINPGAPGLPSVLDDFLGTVVNTSLWALHSGAQNCADSNLQMDISTSGGYTHSLYIYNLSNRHVAVNIASLGNIMSLAAHARLPAIQIGSVASGDELDHFDVISGGNYTAAFVVEPIAGENQLYPSYSHDNGSGTTVTVNVTAVTETLALPKHSHLRMRSAAGTFYWERSPDGINWTVIHSIAQPADWNLQRCIIEVWEHTS